MAERVERQPAFVLHERAYRETSALLELFTRDFGRVAVVARGLRAQIPRFPRGSLRATQAIECGLLLQGELGQLTAVEPSGPPIAIVGMQLQSMLYVNELLVRLLARHDPHPELFSAYAGLLSSLPIDNASLAFALRRFEGRVLAEIGYGIDFGMDGVSDQAVAADGWYRVTPEQGVVTARETSPGAISGRALLALQGTETPDADTLRAQRRMMRALLLHHLGGRELNAWRVLRSPTPPATPA